MNTVEKAVMNRSTSKQSTSYLVDCILGKSEFNMMDHLLHMKEDRLKCSAQSAEKAKRIRENSLKNLVGIEKDALKRAPSTGSWLSIVPSNSNVATLSKREFCDTARLRYGLTPPNLPAKCDGCNSKFDMDHTLNCKHGGLVIQRHDEIKNELGYLMSSALTPSAVRDEPSIYISQNAQEGEEGHVSLKSNRGDLLVRGLWERGTDCILDVQVTNLDASTYSGKDAMKVIGQMERKKRKKYGEGCSDQRRHFTPFVTSTDGMVGSAGQETMKQIAGFLAQKWRKPYSQVCGFVRGRISVAISRATNRCVRGSRVPSQCMSHTRPHWEDGSGLGYGWLL